MARPSRSKRKEARARERSLSGDGSETLSDGAAIRAPNEPSSRRKSLRKRPAKVALHGSLRHAAGRQHADSGGPREGVPVVAKVGLAAIAILLVLYLLSRTR